MNLLDAAIAAVSPARAVKRAQARTVLAAYEGGKSTKRRKKNKDNSTGERQVVRDAATVRATMRDLERNHDLLRGALLTLTRSVIGPAGISVEPTPRIGKPGDDDYDDIDDDFARDLLNLWRDWTASPEVTRTMSWVQAQELACRSWLRDGEVFVQLVEGNGAYIRHATRIPLSLELLEADVVPLNYDSDTPKIQAGIERNEWGQPIAYHVHKRHPGNGGWFVENDLKRVPAERFLHLAVRERLSGLRGISLFASAIDRLLDIKDYEESERTAARIAARIAAFIKRDKDMEGFQPAVDDQGANVERDFLLEAGALFTELYPGESIEMVNPNRPNTALGDFRMNMLRAASRPAQLSYSSFAGDYDGTYSAQRQELVESYDGYRMLTQQFVARFIQPVWERFVQMAIVSGQLKVPAHIRPETVSQAEFRGPKMPWIDPKKEADAMLIMSRGGIQSLQQLIAERGGRLQDVFEQLRRERALADELGLVLESDARNTLATAQAAPAAEDVDEEETPRRKQRSRAARMRLVNNGATA